MERGAGTNRATPKEKAKMAKTRERKEKAREKAVEMLGTRRATSGRTARKSQTRNRSEDGYGFTERLADALPSTLTTEVGTSVDFWATAHRCTDLRKLGCALAWWLARDSDVSLKAWNSRIFHTMYSSDVWDRAVSRHMALPIRVGELWKV